MKLFWDDFSISSPSPTFYVIQVFMICDRMMATVVIRLTLLSFPMSDWIPGYPPRPQSWVLRALQFSPRSWSGWENRLNCSSFTNRIHQEHQQLLLMKVWIALRANHAVQSVSFWSQQTCWKRMAPKNHQLLRNQLRIRMSQTLFLSQFYSIPFSYVQPQAEKIFSQSYLLKTSFYKYMEEIYFMWPRS